MSASYEINITPRARKDLQLILEYISMDSPQNAARMIKRLLDSIQDLEEMPYRYREPRRGRRSSPQVRSMPVKNYLVTYRIDEAARIIYVVAVSHGARRR